MENEKGNILIYQSEDGHARIEVRLKDETVWLTQADMVRLFQSSKSKQSKPSVNAVQNKRQLPNYRRCLSLWGKRAFGSTSFVYPDLFVISIC
ncbi:MAG: hypothetical protein LBH80_02600 [Prevotellaceae bacterium]|jgi:hypothetical protein|nr:hypothetical protein [Prevotellaceae bacterium]